LLALTGKDTNNKQHIS